MFWSRLVRSGLQHDILVFPSHILLMEFLMAVCVLYWLLSQVCRGFMFLHGATTSESPRAMFRRFPPQTFRGLSFSLSAALHWLVTVYSWQDVAPWNHKDTTILDPLLRSSQMMGSRNQRRAWTGACHFELKANSATPPRWITGGANGKLGSVYSRFSSSSY